MATTDDAPQDAPKGLTESGEVELMDILLGAQYGFSPVWRGKFTPFWDGTVELERRKQAAAKIQALIAASNAAAVSEALEKMKREWGHGDTGMDWEEYIDQELDRLNGSSPESEPRKV